MRSSRGRACRTVHRVGNLGPKQLRGLTGEVEPEPSRREGFCSPVQPGRNELPDSSFASAEAIRDQSPGLDWLVPELTVRGAATLHLHCSAHGEGRRAGGAGGGESGPSDGSWPAPTGLAAVDHINAVIREEDPENTLLALTRPEAQLPAVYPFAAAMYQTELFNLQKQNAMVSAGPQGGVASPPPASLSSHEGQARLSLARPGAGLDFQEGTHTNTQKSRWFLSSV